MSLKVRVVLVLLLVFTLYTGLSLLIQRFVVFPRFVMLEREKALTDMLRVVQALQNEASHLNQFCYDWAAWDDTYRFVQDSNADYVVGNLPIETFTGNGIHLLYIVDIDGNVVWGKAYDSDNAEEIALQAFPSPRFPFTHRLLAHDGCHSSIAGILLTERGPLLVASRPIITSMDEGPARGTLVMGRFLTEEVAEKLREQTSVHCTWSPARGSLMEGGHHTIIERIRDGGPVLIEAKDRDTLQVHALYPDVYGMPGLLLQVEAHRDVTARGREASRFAHVSVGLAGLLVLLVTYVLLEKVVVTPLENLTAHAVAVGSSSNLSARLGLKRMDEIGVCACEFDRMVARLAETQKKLLEQSFYSGMAEMAAGTLHNIRNALSPMTVQMDALRQKLRNMPIERIGQAQCELAREDISEQRRADMTRFLGLAVGRLSVLLSKSAEDADVVARQAARVEDILAEQDHYTKTARLIETCHLGELLQDARALVPAPLRELATIEMSPGIEDLPPVRVQRIVLLQVFANLITNAIESIQRFGTAGGRIAVDAVLEQGNGLEMVHVRVCDNGLGIQADKLERIFERSYSTKEGVESGLGLHWCANALTAMDGRIYAESSGPGKGACLHVLLSSRSSIEGYDQR